MGNPSATRMSIYASLIAVFSSSFQKMVGLTGLEPVTPRLSSACSNQLSYRPAFYSYKVFQLHTIFAVLVFLFSEWECCSHLYGGGTGTRTPDMQLAKLPLYQLSYTPSWSTLYTSSVSKVIYPASRLGL